MSNIESSDFYQKYYSRRKKDYIMEKTKDFTTGSVLGSLIKFAIPVLAAMFLQSLYGGVDLLVVGQFAETADISGVSTGSQHFL